MIGSTASGASLMPPHKFLQLRFWYYQLQKILKYDFRVVSSVILFKQNFIKIQIVFLELNHASKQTDRYAQHHMPHFMHTMQKTEQLSSHQIRQLHLCGHPFRLQINRMGRHRRSALVATHT